jgi:AcrR family transcriptional regulator
MREYRSIKREQAALETRRRIRAAGTELFERGGFTATSMSAIAARAGVSERTVFIAFPTKAALLAECIRVAVRGDDEEVPMLERPSWQRALDADPASALRLCSEAAAALMERTARLLAVGESVDLSDPALLEARRRGRAATRSDALATAKSLKQQGVVPRGMSAQRAADIFYSLAASESLYLRMVDHCGWSTGEYARFLERALAGAFSR